MKKSERVLTVLTIVKFIVPFILALISLRLTHDVRFPIAVLVDSLIAFAITNLVASWNKIVAWVVSVLLMFIIYAQTSVMFFTSRYIQLIMLTNLESIEALQGHALTYGSMVALSLLVLFMPVTYIKIHEKNRTILVCALVACCWVPFVLRAYSPFAGAVSLADSARLRHEAELRISNIAAEHPAEILDEFYSDTVGDGRYAPADLTHKPNVIIIFTEGLSSRVIDDERDIMPNVRYYREHSLNFDNYYDHTAATYRGIIGQLYSSHQYHNGDTNTLVSLESVFSDYGYETTFVNPEPEQEPFVVYLDSLGFDTLTSGGITEGLISDQDDYAIVLDNLREGVESGVPQLVATYTFGTHVAMDPDEYKFDDGSISILNRFHNCDAAFGEFMDNLREEGLLENTVIIFTTDHATYVDDDYLAGFSGEDRFDSFCDEIPLFIYYEGIEPETIDAGGRNSLEFAPTVLDYLDMDAPNYFLGTSLFLPMRNPLMETVFCVPEGGWRTSSADGELRNLTDEEIQEFSAQLERYLSLTTATDNPI